jgi:hypothetical protein
MKLNTWGKSLENKNFIHEKINSNVDVGNDFYLLVQSFLFFPVFLNINVKIYRTTNLSVVLCWCEIRSLTLRENKQRLKEVEIINTMHRFAPLLYSIYWLLHVSAGVCHHQGASGSV